MVRTRSRNKNDEEEERKKWDVILKGLKQIVLRKQREIDYLCQERDILAQRLLNTRHSSHQDALLLRNHISQLRRQLELSRLSNSTNTAHSHFLSASYDKDAFLLNSRLEETRHQLDDFRSCFHILSHTPATNGNSDAPSDQHSHSLSDQLASLQRQYHTLSLNHTSQLASLQAEIKFAWSQFNEKELLFTNQLHSKNDQLNKANDKISILLHTLEQLQSSNSHKDHLLSTLRANINSLETHARLKDETIANLSKQSNTPIGISSLNRCSADPLSTSKRTRSNLQVQQSSYAQIQAANASLRSQLTTLEIQANLKNEEIAALSKELNSLKSKTIGSTGSVVPKEEASEKGSKRSKRKRGDVISIEETPRLFTSEFRVPKLRSQTPDRR